VDPYSLNPDPEFHVNPDPEFHVNPDPGFGYQKLKKKIQKNFTAEKFVSSFFDQKFQFTYPWASLKLEEKPSAYKREHQALQNMKFRNFFLFFWVIFALLDPDPD
jgi:hypothetical protein